MSLRTRAVPLNLDRLALFADCSPRELRMIGQACTPISVPAGRVLCRQGDLARECFVVVDGRALVEIDWCTVGTIDGGELVGELALLAPGGRRTATVTAHGDMSLLVLSRREFTSVMSAVPRVAHAVLREATVRLLQNLSACRVTAR